MDICLFLDLYAIKLLSLIFVNVLVTFFVVRSLKAPALKHPYVAIPMDTPNCKPSDSNLNLSLTVSDTESALSEPSSNDSLGSRPITPDLIASGSASESSSSSNTSYGSSASGKCFRMSKLSNTNFQRDDSRSSESVSPYHTTFDDSASQNTPPIIISPPRQEQMIDGSTPSPSPVVERIPQRPRGVRSTDRGRRSHGMRVLPSYHIREYLTTRLAAAYSKLITVFCEIRMA